METATRPYAFSRKVFCEGMRDGVPIALGYFAVSFSLGIAARKAGLTPVQGFFASLLNNASAGEYAAFALIASGATYLEVAIITLIANARYLLMSCALAQRFAPGTPFFHRLIIGYDVTDELFGITIARPGWLNPFYTYGAIALAAPAWAAGTACGIIAGNLLPLAGRQRVERGTLRHVPGHHHSPCPQEQGGGRAGGHQFCTELCLHLSAGHLGTLRWHPHHSAHGGHLLRCRDSLPGQARGGQPMNNWIYIAVMFAVSYAIRILPLTLIRKPIENQFIQSFLYYVPYVTLAVMTFPAIVNATQSPIAGAAALVVGIIAAWMGAGLFPVSVLCCAVVLVLEFFLVH